MRSLLKKVILPCWQNRLMYLVVLLASIVPFQGVSQEQLVLKPCHIKGLSEQVECASYRVPENYEAPQADRELSIFVVRLPAVSSGAAKDPIFFLAGGPGQAASEIAPIMNRVFNTARQTRDLVFIDQRGTGQSNPLQCETEVEALWDLLALEEDAYDVAESIVGCIPEGQDLQQFSTYNAVRDFEQVKQALGYEQVNLYGGSYGTRSGLAYMKAFPESIRSAVLDGVAPPQVTLGLFAHTASLAFQGVLDDCAAQATCQQAFPHLKTDYLALQSRLAQQSELIEAQDPRSHKKTAVRITLNRFYQAIFPALYHPRSRQLIPYVVHAASQGNYIPLLGLSGPFDPEPNLYTGLTLSVLCQEDVPRITEAEAQAEADAFFLGAYSMKNLQRMCQNWPVQLTDKASWEPVQSDIPTLLLSGRQDPVTPPAWAELAQQTLSRSQHFIAEAGSHTIASHTCANELATEFIAQPNELLDGSCLGKTTVLPFVINVNASTYAEGK